ncbi:MAG: GNAT family N-acetyltransferase [Lentisphaeraceae bacterium]|nr:GNAT family N-acetyltransferase [Lentisphaeraceae bacterium]
MEHVKLSRLFNVDKTKLIELMNTPQVGVHLPLLSGEFTEYDCNRFLKSKKKIWDKYGYGPHAITINNEFAGWGGFQPEGKDVDFALILHPDFWGWGLKIFKKFRTIAFEEMGLKSISVLLPPSRLNAKAISKLGFQFESKVILDEENFIKYKLTIPS